MEKGKIDLNEFKEIKIISTGYTRAGAQNAEDEGIHGITRRLLG